ncbi:hypothetical protein RD792_004336 [Penstemon davidsonii]|uniref:ATP synthase F1 complex delta/epsilon subunit N-terminal domain-containing protein n=1 Tax=Penstemon davidsonii TaxID=160366 RepID=A0ABR0DH37_9LAMI|nr:hypothetical protein RD792_004336 [Penstemon davidsonii]
MFRRAIVTRRLFSTSEAASADDLFVAAWKRTVPNLDPPKIPLTFKNPRSSPTPSEKLTINLVSPYSSHFSNKQVDMVVVPASTGQMGILPRQEASISELNPGLLSIHEGNQVTKYFISSGFAFVHSNSIADIIAIEAVPVEQIDPSSVQKGLVEFTQKLSTASTDLEKAEAQIGLDVLTALNHSLSV